MGEVVRVSGVLGTTRYEREESWGVELRVPFQPATFHIKDDLKALQFYCDMEARTWVLPPDRHTPTKEQRLRHLLQHGALPPPGARLAPAGRRPDEEEEEEEEAEEEEPDLGPPPQAASARAAAAAAAQRRNPQLPPARPPAPAGPAPQGTPAQRERRRVRAREAEPAEREFVDGRVAMRREADGRFMLEGHPLKEIRPQLERVLHFRPLPGGVGYLPAWRSAWPLSGAEETYLAALLAHRERKMREGAAYDELVPLPPGCVLPARFHPMGPGGVPLPPPCITRSGRPQNIGRMFFSSWQGGPGSFLWADGTASGGPEAMARCEEYEFRQMLEEEEGWEEGWAVGGAPPQRQQQAQAQAPAGAVQRQQQQQQQPPAGQRRRRQQVIDLADTTSSGSSSSEGEEEAEEELETSSGSEEEEADSSEWSGE